MKIFKNKNFLIVIIGLILIIIASIYFFTKDTDEIVLNTNELFYENATIQSNPVDEKIAVHIIGEVNSPGLIYLDKNSRIADAIDIAGGITDIADLDKVNLAYELQDGQKIYIPSIYDTEITNYISENAGNNIVENDTNNTLININTATQSELEALPGIGEATAKKIIEYRTQNGKFKTIEDIMNVSRNWRKQI